MKVIEKERTVKISVKELISLEVDWKRVILPIPLRIRANKGTEIHQAYQKQAEDAETEVYIKIQVKVDGWNFIITGRADCVYENEKSLVIEEIKSVIDLKLYNIESEMVQSFKRQLLIYSYFFSKSEKRIQCNLVLIDLNTREKRIIETPYSDQTDYINEQCKKIIVFWKQERKEKERLSKRAKTILFPFPSYRPNQEKIIEHVEDLLEKKGCLMLSAPSGLGKTVGTLYPALKFAIKKNKRLFVVTSKTTQQIIYRDTLKRFRKEKGKFKSIILTAKEKLCINSSFICDKQYCKYLKNYETKDLAEIIKESLSKNILSSTSIKKIALKHQVCPFELSLDCCLSCDVIIGDYNYVFNPQIRLKRFFDNSYKDIILIIDEAHNLPFRALDYYSPSISMNQIIAAEEYLKSLHLLNSTEMEGIRIFQKIQEYFCKSISYFQNTRTVEKVVVNFNQGIFQKIQEDFEKFIFQFMTSYYKRFKTFPGRKDEVISFIINFKYFYDILKETDSPEFSQLLYISEEKIKILCKSASLKLEKQMRGFHSVIAQSATLFPFEYFQKMLGFPKKAKNVEFTSPYPENNRLFLTYPYVSTKYRERDSSYKKIADLISEAIKCKTGNYLAFFPSFNYLNAVHKEIEKNNLPLKILVQERKMTGKKRKEYLKKLKTGENSYLLLGVLGGIYSEGIDFLGDMAIGTFIISPGLPTYCFERNLIQKYYEFKWHKGFDYAYRNIGMIKVIQAAGRIFRSFSDKGFVIMIGFRFGTPYYQEVLPKDWNIEIHEDVKPRIETFWNFGQN
ncbi:MAG: ATP-dependent DNA helicase [Promethearchaeota archaeon]